MFPSALEPWLLDRARRPLVMGILNVTPDSFSDGGRFDTIDRAVEHAHQMVAEGADLLDIGGESTRPGSEAVSTDDQIRRVVPVIERLRGLDVVISIDTTDARVAAAALDAGATMINDISAARFDPDMLPLAARRQVPIVLMHMLGTPQTMQDDPRYADVVAEVRTFLLERASAAEAAGVVRHRILLDVGIGFGKTIDHNLTLLREYGQFTSLGYATLLGASRKGFLGNLTGGLPAGQRAIATAATTACGVAQGASIVRVHDVAENWQALRVADAIRRGRASCP